MRRRCRLPPRWSAISHLDDDGTAFMGARRSQLAGDTEKGESGYQVCRCEVGDMPQETVERNESFCNAQASAMSLSSSIARLYKALETTAGPTWTSVFPMFLHQASFSSQPPQSGAAATLTTEALPVAFPIIGSIDLFQSLRKALHDDGQNHDWCTTCRLTIILELQLAPSLRDRAHQSHSLSSLGHCVGM